MLKHIIIRLLIFLIPITFNKISGQDAFKVKEKEEIQRIIEDYIMANPEVILNSVAEMRSREEREREIAAKNNLIDLKDEIMNNPTDPVGGNPMGDVTVVEFFDYRCGYCKQFYTALNEVIDEDDNVRVVFKELPVLGPSSVLAARAAIAASRQNLYNDFHKRMMESKGSFDESQLFDIAEDVGLDVVRLKKDMELRGVQGILDDTKVLADKLSISGTPAIIVGEELIRGAIGKERLKSLIGQVRN